MGINVVSQVNVFLEIGGKCLIFLGFAKHSGFLWITLLKIRVDGLKPFENQAFRQIARFAGNE